MTQIAGDGKVKVFLEPEYIERMASKADNQRDDLMVSLSYRLAAHASEIAALAVDDIDLDRGVVHIRRPRGRTILQCPDCKTTLFKTHKFCPECGKNIEKAISYKLDYQVVRTVKLDDKNLRKLDEFIKRGGPVLKDGKWLIFGISRYRAWQIVRECAEKAGLGKLVDPVTGQSYNVSPCRLRAAFKINDSRINSTENSSKPLNKRSRRTKSTPEGDN